MCCKGDVAEIGENGKTKAKKKSSRRNRDSIGQKHLQKGGETADSLYPERTSKGEVRHNCGHGATGKRGDEILSKTIWGNTDKREREVTENTTPAIKKKRDDLKNRKKPASRKGGSHRRKAQEGKNPSCVIRKTTRSSS